MSKAIPVAIMVVVASATLSDAKPLDVLTRFSYTEYHMGVDARLVVYAPDRAAAERACTAAFKRIAELDAIMSDYRRDSELNRLCARAGSGPVPVSRDLFLVLSRAQLVSERTGGAFDVTVGPSVRLWRHARKFKVLPLPDEIAAAKALVGFRMMRLDPRRRTVALEKKGMQLDLGGIAKGYADDEAQRVLRSFGIDRALVEMGGDIVVSGPPPGKKGWKIAIPNAMPSPSEPQRSELRTGSGVGEDASFSNCAVSTSGDTEQFVVIGGKRYSHVVDPRTGWAVTNRIQATVIAKDGLTSDPISKIFALLDPFEAHKVALTFGVKRAFVKVATVRG